jgi:hypothetical protein
MGRPDAGVAASIVFGPFVVEAALTRKTEANVRCGPAAMTQFGHLRDLSRLDTCAPGSTWAARRSMS